MHGLSLDVDDVSIIGAGEDKTILNFQNQVSSAQGLLVTSDRVLLKDFAIEDAKGDAVNSKGFSYKSSLDTLKDLSYCFESASLSNISILTGSVNTEVSGNLIWIALSESVLPNSPCLIIHSG